MTKNIVWHEQLVTKEEQRRRNRHHSAVLYFTGLSGSGKSTIANAAARKLHDLGANTYVLDGDNVRHGLNSDLGFSDEARKENIRRIGEVAKLFIDSGQLVFTAFISPFQEDRDSVRRLVEADEFVEVYISCPLEACEERDPKGLYEKARAGVIPEFTGISSPYEAPVQPELVLETDRFTIDECVEQLISYLRKNKWID
ncbi:MULTISPECIES: adenylyl-sulfate kinase [unclassified Sporosarcina]|uniref:adenylyl-sulfate kinase n=1 Tax=unclassified Sporosarcina TaxID=2647733 RepID=UPI002041F131|nr:MULTISPECIES: adenylyl-sulfate kinase [unclassified Sporosarcina]GKV65046.1 adenylyl-sulfate kinase [Sporosarcina sp. NCCP-2331]GLB56913.1 adenylyl-sulfate kinase [Sporosarcina sp. NCCP-2378]